MVYLVYLADADRDTATFAVFTYPVHQVDDRQEDRAPSLVSLKKTNVAMCALGKPCPVIATREQLDRWLAGRSGWAAIRPEAAQLVPHWLGEAVEYACSRFRLGSVEFEEPWYMWTVEFVGVDMPGGCYDLVCPIRLVRAVAGRREVRVVQTDHKQLGGVQATVAMRRITRECGKLDRSKASPMTAKSSG